MVAQVLGIVAAAVGLFALGLVLGYWSGRKRTQTVMVFPSVRDAPIVYEAGKLRRVESYLPPMEAARADRGG